jgi:alpha-methylacyl-CoA racemase
MQTAPAPKFSRTKGEVLRGPIAAGTNTATILKEIGFVQEKISQLIASGVVMSVENTTN